MTLNANFPGARVSSTRKLEGPERGLDALVGLIILVAELLIGLMSIYALYLYGQAIGGAGNDSVEFGFGFAVFVGGIVVVITTLVYLVRIAAGRRSWPAPLWGAILMSVALVVGYFIMSTGG
jgi:hypothetical protein